MRDRLAAVLAVLSVIMVAGGVVLATSSTASADNDTPIACGTPAKEAVYETIHHDAVTHVVHHNAVPAGPDLWWNWSPNDTNGPQDYTPAFPADERGTWQGPHENGGPAQDTYGTFNASNENSGNSSWFHREHGTPAVDASDETVVDKAAFDERVLKTPATPAGPPCSATCPAGSDRNAGKQIPAGQTAVTFCNEADIAPNEGSKPPSVKPSGDVAGTGAGVAGTSAGVAGTSAGVAGTSAGVAGTDASVPSSVNAGIGGTTAGASTLQLVGQLLTGAGLLLLVGACWSGAGRRRRVVGTS